MKFQFHESFLHIQKKENIAWHDFFFLNLKDQKKITHYMNLSWTPRTHI
jgi:hypothetical protein